MKKFLIILGSIFLALIALGALGIGFLAVRGNALDKESKAYADTAIPAIVTTWDKKELMGRVSPEFKQAVTADQVDRLVRWMSSLGRLQKCESAQGQSYQSVSHTGKQITAKYTAKAQFQKEKQLLTSFLSNMVISGRTADSMSTPLNLFHLKRSNQLMKPTAPFRESFSMFAMPPCRGLSLSR